MSTVISSASAPLPKTVYRVESIDLLRGLIMIIMALDHVRDYFHAGAVVFDPTDLSQTNIILYFTRWITHFCAPVFMFLSGTSAFLVGERKGRKALSRFLLTRGLWLVFLEFTVVNFGWYFNFPQPSIDFLVIWALGISMIALAGLIYLPLPWILFISLAMVFGHNLLDDISVPGNDLSSILWSLFHQANFYQFKDFTLFVGYPVIPWIGVMALGYCLGK
ncbi:MAG TPA: heparan-alpha-glucosaminide N-acetyltransferase domain-containing protein, partial [Chitinophagaceae bacterium]